MNRALHALLFSAAFAVGCTTSEPRDPNEGPVRFTNPGAFYDLLHLARASYVPLSADELIERSEFIGRGIIGDVQDGMVIRSVHAKVPSALYSLVIRLDVEQVVKGRADQGSVYFVYWHGGAFMADTYRANMPSSGLLVFLVPATYRQSESVEYLKKDAGHPPGTVVYRLTTPQGWLVDEGGSVREALAGGKGVDENSPFGSMSSLQEVADQIGADSADAGTPEEGTRPTPGEKDM